jgi:hypothetical protein
MLKTSVLLGITLALLATAALSPASNLSALAFLQAVATFLLLVWTPTRIASKGVRLVLFFASGFFGCVFLLAGLFTLWWPPGDPLMVLWSSLTLVFLFLLVLRNEVT